MISFRIETGAGWIVAGSIGLAAACGDDRDDLVDVDASTPDAAAGAGAGGTDAGGGSGPELDAGGGIPGNDASVPPSRVDAGTGGTVPDATADDAAVDVMVPDGGDDAMDGGVADGDAGVESLAIVGVYDDDFGGRHAIDASSWMQDYSGAISSFDISQWDNGARFVIARNDSANSFFPDLWSRFDWTDFAGDLYYCSSAFDAADEDAALTAVAADPTDPTTGGCGGFTWTKLIPVEIVGVYADDFGTDHEITAATWTQASSFGTSVFRITDFDADADFLIAQNAPSNDFNADLWSRFEWTVHAGELYFCQVAFDAASEAAALAAGPADPSDPSNGGCSGFSWSRLSEQ